MRIDHAYKGLTDASVVLFDDGMCDGPTLQVGEQYLMYTRRVGSGDIPSRGCTRSTHVKYADEDLKFLNGLPDARPVSSIFGRVVVRTDDYRGNDQPLAGAQVEISGTAGTYNTMTDGDGRYWFENLQPETYRVAAASNGFRMMLFGMQKPSAKVEPRGCAAVNMIMRRTWHGRIAGRVVRSNGEPAPAGIDLTLIQLEKREGKEQSNFLFGSGASTNDQGEYSFDEVAPGRYKVVMNMYRFPTGNFPYPTIYWPGSRNEAAAIAIEVTDAAVAQLYDFSLPPEPKSVRVSGLVIGPDGRPANGVQVYITALPDNNVAMNDENRPQTDAEGRFSFTALEGWEYRLRAIQSGSRSFHSGDMHFTLKDSQPSLTLVCDRPGRFDNDPVELRRQNKPEK
ncbi:MAG: carboxypeptidase regulatory-like domain-containing protein [Acidobacteria bacterium]|nr:carboxypeptidase regulatory-like domain-containing protein [Acidobacteriota bacterium]